MRKIYSLLFALALLGATKMNAQVSVLLNTTYGYTFSNTTTTYTSLTGGTVFQSAAALNTDANSAAITLPFAFTFNGIKENTIFINNNGYITFALAQTTASTTVPLSTTTTSGYDGVIAGLANNLVAAATGTPEIRYGSNVGGDFVIQFQDLAISTFTSTRITFQIVLKADGKTVQVVYGPNNTGQASATGSQVGLRGTNDEDWNNRSLASGGNWNTAGGAAGTANTSTMTWTASSTLPTSGRTFQWVPTSYTPTYLTGAGGVVQEFTSWVNGAGPANIPSTNWATNGYGNASWQIDNTTASTTGSGWTGTSGPYSPVDYLSASGGHSARFHSQISNSPQVGYLDYYVDLSAISGTPTIDFYQINPSGTDILQVYLSTNGGTSFTKIGADFGVATTWTSRSISLGATNSATTIIRFKATSDFGSDDIGLDHVVVTPPAVQPVITSFTPGTNLCVGGTQTVTITGTGFTGITSVTFNGVNATSFTVVSSTSITAVTPSSLTAGPIVVTNSAGSGTSSAYTIAANPTVTATPSSATFCSPGGTGVSILAGGASTYAWSPATGLTAATGATVTATPSITTLYTVTGTDVNGCKNTATSNITVAANPTGISATATLSSICSGTTSQLSSTFMPGLANTYSFVGSTGTYAAITGTTLGAGAIGDDAGIGNLPIGFTFNYNGASFSVFGARSNGLIELGQATASLSGFSANALATTANCIAPLWDDNNTTGGSIIYTTSGTAPNRILTVQWTAMHVGNAGGASQPTIDMQVKLYESSNKIEFVYGATSAAFTTTTASIGISGASGNFVSVTPLSPANTSTKSIVTENTSVSSATNFPTGTTYTFAPTSSYTYSWSPSGDVVSPTSQNTLTNALTADKNFILTVTSGTCSVTANAAVTVVSGATITTDPVPSTKCAGQTATFSVVAAGPSLTYQWRKGGVNILISGNASAGTANLTLTNVLVTDAGSYDVVVTSTCGSPATSAAVALAVNAIPTAIAGSNSPVCAGTTLNLTGSTDIGTTYSWTGPNSYTSALQNPTITGVTSAAAGTYSFTATTAGCSSAVSTTTVVVNAIPTGVTATASLNTICEGASINLTSTPSTPPATILSEGFETGATGWLFQDSSSTGTAISAQIFHIETAPYTDGTGSATFLNFSITGSKFAYANADAGGSSSSNTRTFMVSPAFSTVGYTGTGTLTFKHAYKYYSSSSPAEQVRVQISTDGGTTWNSLQNYEGADKGTVANNAEVAVATSITIPSNYMGLSNLKLRWRYTSNWGYFWVIDDVLLTGTPVPYTYSWTSVPAGFTSTLQNPTNVAPSVNTTYSVQVSNTNCAVSSSTSLVTVNPNYTITASAGANGTISPNGATTLSCTGTGSQVYTITPSTSCYSVADVLVDGVSQGAITSYTFTNVTTNHTISASFALKTYAITVSAGANGSITPSTTNVNCGSNATYTITPASCYQIADVVVDGVSQGTVGTYTFTNVTGTHTISASFSQITYAITVSAGANGSIAPSTGNVNCGDNATYTITANSLYEISDVIVDGVSQGIISTYTFSNVTAPHTISASFILSCVNVSITSATAAASPICSDATTTLTANGVSGTNATVTWWTGTGGTGTNLGTGTTLVAGPGTYFAYVTGNCGTPAEAGVTVGTTANTVITTDAAPSSQTVLVNDPSPANLTVTATGAGLTYQWFSNVSNSNAGGTTVGAANGGQTNTFTSPTNVLGTKYYYAVVTGTCGTVTSSAVAVTITNTNTWKAGNATTNWSLAANWTGNAVPTGANDAAIPVGNTPYPALTVSVSVNNLVIDPTATVSLNGFTLTTNGAVTGTGTLSGSATSAVVTNASTGLLFTPGANTLKDLTVSAGTTTLSNALNITGGTAANTYGTVTVAPGATLASGGNLTIKSNQFGTARVAAGDVAGNYITGDVTVERYIPQNSKRAWRLLSVPTKGTKTIKQTWQENQAAGANGTPGFGTIITSNIATAAPLQAAGFDAYSQLPSMQSYNSATQGWVYVTSTNAAPIQSNKGYFLYIRGDRSVTTSSSTDAASATTLRTTGTLYQGNSNPAVSIAAGKFEPVGNTFASAIDFTSLSKTGGISNTFYVWDSKLLSGTTLGAYQTFNGSIGYTPATPGGSYPAGVPNTSIESGEAFMLGATGTAGTVTLVEASKTAGNQFTPFRPAALPAQFKTGLLKVTGSTTVLADNNIVVFDNAYKNAVDADDALKIQKAGETMSILTDGKALIIDARQPVSSTDVISFNISNLQPQAYKLSFSTQNMNTAGLTAFVEDKYLQTSTAINLDGASDYGFTADAANAASSAPDRFRVVFKKAGAMAIAATKAGFTISPNPVEGGVVNVQFKNQLAGKYSIRLLDAGGAVIFSTFATHGGGSSTQVLSLPGGVARGAYQLEITSPSKERELQTLFINSIK